MGVAWLEFYGENFRGWRENRKIRESFLPRKFPYISTGLRQRREHVKFGARQRRQHAACKVFVGYTRKILYIILFH